MSSTPLPAHVPWLRKTEYISREGVQRGSGVQEPYVTNIFVCKFYWCAESINRRYRKLTPQAHIDISRTAQLSTIESSFAANNPSSSTVASLSSAAEFDLKSLRHPNKPNIAAVDSYEIFPDADVWANAYDLFRFSERPGERSVEVCIPLLNPKR